MLQAKAIERKKEKKKNLVFFCVRARGRSPIFPLASPLREIFLPPPRSGCFQQNNEVVTLLQDKRKRRLYERPHEHSKTLEMRPGVKETQLRTCNIQLRFNTGEIVSSRRRRRRGLVSCRVLGSSYVEKRLILTSACLRIRASG